MTGAAPTMTVYAALGAGGAYVDISDRLDAGQDFTRGYGQSDAFGPVRSGSFSMVFVNNDGALSPDNPSGSTYVLAMTERIGVTWRVNNSRQLSGKVSTIEPFFLNGNTNQARVRLTVDDILVDLDRAEGRGLRRAWIDKYAANHWAFSGTENLKSVSDTGVAGSTATDMLIVGDPDATQFGSQPVGTFSFDTGASFNGDSDSSAPRAFASSKGLNLDSNDVSVVIQVQMLREVTKTPRVIEIEDSYFGTIQYRVGTPSTGVPDRLWVAGTSADMPSSMQVGRSYKLTIRALTATLFPGPSYIARVSASLDTAFSLGGSATISLAPVSATSHTVTSLRICLDNSPALVERVYTTESGTTSLDGVSRFGDTATATATRIADLATLGGFTVDVESGFDSYCGGQNDNTSYLDALTQAVGVEGGRFWVKDTGTQTVPVQTVACRPRTTGRPSASTITLDADLDFLSVPDIVRDLSDKVSIVNASSNTAAFRVIDSTLQAVLGDVSDDLAAPAFYDGWLRNLAEDRIRRGSVAVSRIESIDIDLRLTSADRVADYLALTPGNRVHLTSLTTMQVPATFDGWLIGADETWNAEASLVTLHIEPAMPMYVFDTARFAAGGVLTLNGAITNSATSISVASSGPLFTVLVGEFPQKIIVDREVMTVSAVSGGSSPQTFTVTRGSTTVDGFATSAVSHLSGAQVEIHPLPVWSL